MPKIQVNPALDDGDACGQHTPSSLPSPTRSINNWHALITYVYVVNDKNRVGLLKKNLIKQKKCKHVMYVL